MTISEALLARTVTSVADLTPAVLASLVLTDTPHGMALTEPQPLLVVRHERLVTSEIGVAALTQQWDGINGTIKMVTGANMTHRGWVYRDHTDPADRHNLRVFGAVINPTPVNGHFYRIIGSDVSSHYIGCIAQYHTEGSINWQIVERSDGLPVSGPDGWQTWDWCSYVEVSFGGDLPEQSTLDAIEEAETTVGIPTPPGTVRRSDLRAVLEINVAHDDDVVTLNPEPISGDVYVGWFEGMDNINPVVLFRMADSWVRIGAISPRYGYESDYSMWEAPSNEAFRWAKLAVRDTQPVSLEAVASRVLELNNETTQMVGSFDGLLGALNDMAENKGWCEEYEAVMDRGGMKGREKDEEPEETRHAYDIEVRARFEWSGNPSSGSVDEAVAEWAEVDSVDVTDVTLTGSKVITIRGRVADNEDEARENLSRSDVEEELDSALSEFDCDRLVDFEIIEINEDTGYDFDD